MFSISNLLPRFLSSKSEIVKEIIVFEDKVHFHLTTFGRGVTMVKASFTG